MTTFANKKIWIVGASEGLGRAIAEKLSAKGAQVILSARSADKLNELAAQLPNATALALDVTDIEAVRVAANKLGDLDGVIYNAGAYDPMSTLEWNSDSALKMVDVNLLGAMRVLGEVVPKFVAANRGEITLIGSLSAYRGLPKSIGYSASKAALVSLAETMRFDLADTDVRVRIVNPGFIKTRLTDKNSFKMPQLMTADEAADHVIKAMGKRKLRTDFPAPFSWAIRFLDYLPDWLVYRGR